MTILVSGLINIETTVRVDGFPIAYTPVRYPFGGVNESVSGVGYNVAKALHTLGSGPRLLSLIGRDMAGRQVYDAMAQAGLDATFIAAELEHTPRSAIFYDPDGRRMINVDLKDVQERTYPAGLFEAASSGATLAVLCNANFSRPFLDNMRSRGVPVATDVHAISDLESAYDRDFMAAATLFFMSDERLPCPPEEWARRLWDRYGTPVIVIGLGAQGTLLAVKDDGFVERIPAVATRPVVSTIGAGDALFACFVHVFHHTGDPYAAIRKAVVFASYKIGAAGAAEGFLDAPGLERLCAGLDTLRPE